MKKSINIGPFEIIGQNYSGSYKYTRYASRGIIMKEGKILLSYEVKKDFWMLPGGGREENENDSECVIREVREETGYITVVKKKTVELIEYYQDMRYVSCYFLCDIVGETAPQLTKGEIEEGLERRWISLEEALDIFSAHNKYKDIYEEKRGAYLREFCALMKMLENGDIELE